MAILAKVSFCSEGTPMIIGVARMFESAVAIAGGTSFAATKLQKIIGVKKSPLSEKSNRFIR